MNRLEIGRSEVTWSARVIAAQTVPSINSPTDNTVNGSPSCGRHERNGPIASQAKIALCRIGAMYRCGGPR